MIFGINIPLVIFRLTAREITYNNFEISLVVFMLNITTNHAITHTNTNCDLTQQAYLGFHGRDEKYY